MEDEAEGSRPQSRASSASRQKTPVELGPIRTGRETPLGERPESASLLLSGTQEDVTEIQMSTSEPLPPIQSKDSTDPVDAETGSLSPTLATSEVIAGTMAGSKAAGHLQKPRIVSYRREMEETFLSDSDSSISSDQDGATRKQNKRGDGAVSAREVRTVKGQDGGEHIVVSVNCQTEWSWLEDMKTTKTTKKRQAQRRGSSKIGSSARVTSADDSLDSSEELDFSRSSSHSNRRRATTGSGSISAVTASPVRSGLVEINTVPASSLGTTSVGDLVAKSGAQSVSGLSVHGVQSEASYISNPPVPTPSRDDEYGIPILQMSSDSESSDDDSVYQYQAKAADDENSESKDTVPTLPSIGPPQILQYQRESKKKKLDADDPENRANEADLRRSRAGDGQRGRHRKHRGSRRSGEDGEGQSGEDEEGGELDGDDPQHISDKDMAEYQSQFRVQEGGIFEGACEFCGKNIKPFPSMSDQKNLAPTELYCCEDYQEFVQFMVMHPLKEQFQKEKKMIDVKPHRAHGNKQVRKAAKERAAQRMRERELARQQAAMSAPSGGGAGGGSAGGPANFYQFARQMKTINYQLSSQKCLEEGWTIRAPSPLCDMMPDGDLFEPEPVLPPWAETEGKKRERKLVLKHYDDGSLFIIMFPDGTGNVFYPSGNVAITIASTEKCLFTFIAHEDHSEQAAILAVFDSNGCGASYYAGGSIRLHLDQLGGLELDPRGGRKKKWSWKDQVSHVHAPPIQPITYAITAHLALRIVGQDNITLTFSTRRRGCRFQVGARLKLVSAENYPIQLIEEDELYRQEVSARVQSIFNRVSNLLKFPNSPKLDKLPTPPHISARMEKVTQLRTSRAESRSQKKGQGQGQIQPVTVT